MEPHVDAMPNKDNTKKDDEERSEVEEYWCDGGREICLDCVHYPCLCDLLKVERKILELLENKGKKGEEDLQVDSEEDREEEPDNEEIEEETKEEPKETGTKMNIKGGGSPRGHSFQYTGLF